jgi:MSHA biogenesis protein MshK
VDKLLTHIWVVALALAMPVMAEESDAKDEGSASDPTAPLTWVAPAKPKAAKKKAYYPVPKLQSIVCVDGNLCSVILNDRLVSQGEWVSGYQVKTIHNEHVVLVRQGKRWVLELFDSTIKQ